MVGHATEPHEAGHGDRRIALLISALAFCLALSSTAGNNAQTEAISRNIKASDLWAFFQASIVLASASIITKVVALAFAADSLGLVGVALGLIGWLAPTALHL